MNSSAQNSTIRLAGDWTILADPNNEGRDRSWFAARRPGAVPAPVPGIIQQVFPTQHGVFWYYHTFAADFPVTLQERAMLRFGAVDYAAEVWVNGQRVGSHEGPETPFELDITHALKMGADNLIAVRVLNPSNQRIEGMVMKETPHRNKLCVEEYWAGAGYNFGGFLLPVELAIVPALRIAAVFARPDAKSGKIPMTLSFQNYTGRSVTAQLRITVAPAAAAGQAVCETTDIPTILPGGSVHEVVVTVRDPLLWDLDTPNLYRITASLECADAGAAIPRHEHSTRVGFRDFRIEDGFFYLNGRRIFLRSTHTGNHVPISWVVPLDPGLLRQDLVMAKAGGYNMVRFISGMAYPEQLDLCDELGLMIYQECYAGWCLQDSPQMAERFDLCVREMVLRDRNHASLTIWGLLNETPDGPVFRHAVESLKLVRSLDTSRLVLLSSGRWDCDYTIGSACNPGSTAWEAVWGIEGPGAKKQSMAPDFEPAGGYAYNAGDAHTYPKAPIRPEIKTFIRTLGAGTKPVFLSEFGIGSLFNAVEEVRPYDRYPGGDIAFDRKFIQSEADRFTADFERWGFGSIYPFPEDLLRESYRRSSDHRRLTFDLVRSNPQFCGYNLTGMLDHGLTGEGIWTFWRAWKPGIAEALQAGWAPLRWCLFADPVNAYAGKPVTVEAVLANDGVLKAGEYPVTFRIFGESQGTVWEKKTKLRIPEGAKGSEAPLALQALRETLNLNLAAGEYTFAACFEKSGNAAADRLKFNVSSPTPGLAGPQRVQLACASAKLERWLRARGVECAPFEPQTSGGAGVVLVGEAPGGNAALWAALRTKAEQGATVVFLSAKPFMEKQPEARPLGDEVSAHVFLDWLYHKEIALKRHAIFDGLQCGALLDWNEYGAVTTSDVFRCTRQPDEVIAAYFSIGVGGNGYEGGVITGAFKRGQGRVLLNSLRITENLDEHPAADRLLANVLSFATRH